MNESEQLLKELVEALEGAFISSWQSTHHWQKELEQARDYLDSKEDTKSYNCPA